MKTFFKEPRQTKKARKAAVAVVRPQIFEESGGYCICCGLRFAQSMHEVKPKSKGGWVSVENSIPVCGSGTTGCHGMLQRNEITATRRGTRWIFRPRYPWAKRWMEGGR